VAKATRSTVNDHIDLLNIETKSLLDEIRVTISKEVEKQIETFNTAATKLLEDKSTRLLSYHNMALRNLSLSISTDPRVLARKGIRARQFIVDIPGNTPLKNFSQAVI
jgi:hypothetical protein